MKKLNYLFLVFAVFSCKKRSDKPDETVIETKEEVTVVPKERQSNLDEYSSLIDSLNVSVAAGILIHQLK